MLVLWLSRIGRGIEAWHNAGFPVIRSNLSPHNSGDAPEPPAIPVMHQVLITAGGIVALSSLLAMIGFELGAFIAFMMGGGLLYAGATGNSGLATLLQRMPWNRK